METETEIEKMKMELALRCDFNVEDAFRIFELNGRGYLTEDDLKYGLSLIDILSTSRDIKILLKRFVLKVKECLALKSFLIW